jgi:hypothetical protein
MTKQRIVSPTEDPVSGMAVAAAQFGGHEVSALWLAQL